MKYELILLVYILKSIDLLQKLILLCCACVRQSQLSQVLRPLKVIESNVILHRFIHKSLTKLRLIIKISDLKSENILRFCWLFNR